MLEVVYDMYVGIPEYVDPREVRDYVGNVLLKSVNLFAIQSLDCYWDGKESEITYAISFRSTKDVTKEIKKAKAKIQKHYNTNHVFLKMHSEYSEK